MVSQFVSPHAVGLLGDLDFDFPEGTHAIGRLDLDSEGLLLLTTDKRITRLVFLAEKPHERSYLVMVQNEMTEETFSTLENGVPIRVGNDAFHLAKPASVLRITDPEKLYPFATDHRKAYAHTWLLINLTEGKFRQVRKMVLALRHRCQRLIRLSISGLELGDLKPGEVRELSAEAFYNGLGISTPSTGSKH
ncbi:MAG: pseudouridylate synthase, small subunit [Ferruginibacter sp.]|nr:pseudouridylate synthase, small subunit [Ferruginibacter sp.]